MYPGHNCEFAKCLTIEQWSKSTLPYRWTIIKDQQDCVACRSYNAPRQRLCMCTMFNNRTLMHRNVQYKSIQKHTTNQVHNAPNPTRSWGLAVPASRPPRCVCTMLCAYGHNDAQWCIVWVYMCTIIQQDRGGGGCNLAHCDLLQFTAIGCNRFAESLQLFQYCVCFTLELDADAIPNVITLGSFTISSITTKKSCFNYLRCGMSHYFVGWRAILEHLVHWNVM